MTTPWMPSRISSHDSSPLACATLFALLAGGLAAKDDYKLGPDSEYQSGVPKGEVTQFKHKSSVFAGTERDVWVYVPAQYDGKAPACVMVFQDGGSYVNVKGQF